MHQHVQARRTAEPKVRRERAGRIASLVAVLSLAFSTALVLYAAQGLRSTDQYWYVADVETLVAGGPPTNNTWFPMGLLRDDGGSYAAPFYHNGPLLHLVAALDARLPLSAYATWIAVNLLCLALTVGVVSLWLRRRTDPVTAGWTTALAALAPIAVWQTANPLRETWFGALGGLALALFHLVPSHRRGLAEPALALTLGVGALSHPMFLVLLVLLATVRAIEWLRERTLGRLLAILPAVLAVGIVRTYAHVWFPSSFQPDLASIVTSVIPNGTNMAWHFADVQATLDVRLLLAKLAAAAERQFLVPPLWPIYLQTHAALIAWLALVARAVREPSARVADGHPTPLELLALGCFLGLYAAMIVLQQNHMRFQQLVAPAAFVLIGYALHVFVPRRLVPVLAAPVLLGFAVVSTAMSMRLHDESIAERADRAALSRAFEFVSAEDRVLFVDVHLYDPLSYILRPAPALFVRSPLISDEAALEAISRFRPTVLVTPDDRIPYGLERFEPVLEIETDLVGPLVIRRPVS